MLNMLNIFVCLVKCEDGVLALVDEAHSRFSSLFLTQQVDFLQVKIMIYFGSNVLEVQRI